MDKDRYLSIDLNSLHLECQRQAELHGEHGKMCATARKEVADAKVKLKLVECEIAKQIRDDPLAFGLQKITEDAIKMTIPLQGRYKAAVATYNRLNAELDVHEVDVEALRDKKSMLESLVKLRLGDYFSEVSLPREGHEALDKERKTDARSRGRRDA